MHIFFQLVGTVLSVKERVSTSLSDVLLTHLIFSLEFQGDRAGVEWGI